MTWSEPAWRLHSLDEIREPVATISAPETPKGSVYRVDAPHMKLLAAVVASVALGNWVVRQVFGVYISYL